MNGWKLGGLGMVWAACAGAPSGPPAAEHTPSWQQLAGQGLGTTWSVQWAQGPDAEVAQGLVVDALSDVDRKMSTWRDDSEIMRLRGEEGAQPISAALATVVDASLDLHAMTGGAFDPTVQPLWRTYAQATQENRAASPAEINAARRLIGFDRLRLDADKITLDQGQMITLNGIAQGYISDQIARFFAQQGIGDVLVNTGEIVAKGQSPTASGWMVEVAGAPEKSLLLKDRAVATSNTEAMRINNTETSHILHPVSNHVRPLTQTTISAPTAALADALSTTACLTETTAQAAQIVAQFAGAKVENQQQL